MATILLEGVGKRFDGGHAGVRDLTLEIRDGELLVLVGPSGSGKSTALRLIAGLEIPTAGRILIDGQDVTGVPPQQRDLAMVFQSYALYPHKTVRENLAFGLRMRGADAAAIASRVGHAARTLQIEGLLERRPSQLSGGQRQRVALGRALVRQPRAFLFDEPLSNLDPALRVETRGELAVLHQRLGTTMVYVTHDQEEAMTLGDRIAVMKDGRIHQVAPPLEVYRRPADLFVARFVGSPAMNVVREMADRGGAAATVAIRPHDVAVVAAGTGDEDATVEVVEPAGHQTFVRLRRTGSDQPLLAVLAGDRVPAPGERVGVRLPAERLHYFSADTGLRLDP